MKITTSHMSDILLVDFLCRPNQTGEERKCLPHRLSSFFFPSGGVGGRKTRQSKYFSPLLNTKWIFNDRPADMLRLQVQCIFFFWILPFFFGQGYITSFIFMTFGAAFIFFMMPFKTKEKWPYGRLAFPATPIDIQSV